MSLWQLEQTYLQNLKSQYIALNAILEKSREENSVNLDSDEITLCLLARLNAYYQMQYSIKELLRKRYITAGADYFVESVIFYLKIILEKSEIGLEVHSERQIKQKRRAIRPDISIWKSNYLVAIIECKTQLGWDRGNWEGKFQARKQQLQAEFPDAKAYLLVMTDVNWGGFKDKEHKQLLGKEYFCLLTKAWPGSMSFEEIRKFIFLERCIERLIASIIDLTGSNQVND
jgi:hypothetical protein